MWSARPSYKLLSITARLLTIGPPSLQVKPEDKERRCSLAKDAIKVCNNKEQAVYSRIAVSLLFYYLICAKP